MMSGLFGRRLLGPELLVVALVVVVALLVRARRPAWARAGWRWVRRAAARPQAVVVATGVAAFLVSATVGGLRPMVPAVTDEYSQLLAGETFALGRLANPPHPLWRHFEASQVLQQPTYASKYPPGQGLAIAAGLVATGRRDVGVWLGYALAAAALCWMLQGWLPGRWAVIGSALFVLQPELQTQWAQTYWGGSIALLGGALLLGALPRVLAKADPGSAALLATGVLVLANSRPFTGAVLSIPVALAILWRRGRGSSAERARWARRVALPAAAVLVLGGAGMGFYNARVTGSPWKLPYALHQETYAYAPLFLWQGARVPTTRSADMQAIHRSVLAGVERERASPESFARSRGRSLYVIWATLLRVIPSLALLALPQVLRRGSMRFAAGLLALSFAACLSVSWSAARYLAPALPLLWVLVVQGCRYLAVGASRGRLGGLLPALLLAQAGLFVARSAIYVGGAPRAPLRQQIERALAGLPSDDLVLVEYDPDRVSTDLTFNAPDIDASPIVWARSLGPEADAELLRYYPDRRVWDLRLGGGGNRIRERVRSGR